MTSLLDHNTIEKLILSLIKKVDMVILGGPYIHRCDISGNEGYTALVAITTSHIVLHTWDTSEIQLDIYSCKSFNQHDVIDLLREFGIVNSVFKFLDRSNSFKEI